MLSIRPYVQWVRRGQSRSRQASDSGELKDLCTSGMSSQGQPGTLRLFQSDSGLAAIHIDALVVCRDLTPCEKGNYRSPSSYRKSGINQIEVCQWKNTFALGLYGVVFSWKLSASRNHHYRKNAASYGQISSFSRVHLFFLQSFVDWTLSSFVLFERLQLS